jgi:hypothetical protein
LLIPVPVIGEGSGEGKSGYSVSPQDRVTPLPEDLNELFYEVAMFLGIIAKGHCLAAPL